jgi:hypothetical protein
MEEETTMEWTVRVVHNFSPHDISRATTENVDAQDANDNTRLHLAAYHRNATVNECNFLVDLGATDGFVNRLGRTPMHTAILKYRYDIAAFLAEVGFSLGCVDDEGKTPWDYHDVSIDNRIVVLASGEKVNGKAYYRDMLERSSRWFHRKPFVMFLAGCGFLAIQ